MQRFTFFSPNIFRNLGSNYTLKKMTYVLSWTIHTIQLIRLNELCTLHMLRTSFIFLLVARAQNTKNLFGAMHYRPISTLRVCHS